MYETILSPVDYGGLRLKNRILFAPTTFGLSDEETLAKYRALAEGGCAMIIVGDVPVGKSRFVPLPNASQMLMCSLCLHFGIQQKYSPISREKISHSCRNSKKRTMQQVHRAFIH